MRKFLLLFFLIPLSSCQYFQSQEKQTKQMVNDKLLAVDWNDVDQYPLFENCDEMSPKDVQRECFLESMLNYFSTDFEDIAYEIEDDINDTIYIDFLINEDGFISVIEIQEKDNINKVLPGLKDTLSSKLKNIRTIAPALKRGVPVRVKFRLPIVLNSTN